MNKGKTFSHMAHVLQYTLNLCLLYKREKANERVFLSLARLLAVLETFFLTLTLIISFMNVASYLAKCITWLKVEPGKERFFQESRKCCEVLMLLCYGNSILTFLKVSKYKNWRLMYISATTRIWSSYWKRVLNTSLFIVCLIIKVKSCSSSKKFLCRK